MRCWLLFLLIYTSLGWSKIDTYEFDSPEREKLYRELTYELRCLVCQNQNIADSNAELAKDLRRKTYQMVQQGKSKQEIVDFMVTRYGDFVLYKPPLQFNTVLLWVGPVLIFIIGLIMLLRFVRQRHDQEPLLDEEQKRKAEQLLKED